MHAIVVHGGAINPLDATFNKGVTDAVMTGFEVLNRGGSSLDAVTETIVNMEDNPIFNSGTGSWANLAGEVEMDAIIMDGATGATGAVASIRRVKNPILVARKVMEETDHILLAGDGATRFARALGFPDYDPLTSERRATWEDMRAKLLRGEKLPMTSYWTKISKFVRSDTVGVVALDKKGSLSAGTSSGGFPFKLPGRVGDVPIVNASTYVSKAGGVSLSGHGEIVIKYIVARQVHDLVASGVKPKAALERVFKKTLKSLKVSEGVLLTGIALNRKGEVGVVRNVDALPHAYMSSELDGPRVGFGPRMK